MFVTSMRRGAVKALMAAMLYLSLAACANPGTSPFCPVDADDNQMVCPDQGGGTGTPAQQ